MTFKQIRESKFTKVVVSYLAIQMLLQFTGGGAKMFALTGGPTQPEFNAFTPIGTSDMVDLSSGDFKYSIPIMDVGGYPLSLGYTAGITADQEASWVGLGWDLSVGQIARQVRGLPDDFKGDKIRYENDRRDNVTVGVNLGAVLGVSGSEISGSVAVGLGVQYNNYTGVTAKNNIGVSMSIHDNVNLGFNYSSSIEDGATIAPSVSFNMLNYETKKKDINTVSGSLGIGFNSRQGLSSINLGASLERGNGIYRYKDGGDGKLEKTQVGKETVKGSLMSNSLSFNDQNYTPSDRTARVVSNFSANFGLGTKIIIGEVQGETTAYGTEEKILNKDQWTPAYGYEFTEYNAGDGVLDFKREKERVYNSLTSVLPLTNYTYDLYSVRGQGIGGMFRSHRSQVSYLRDAQIKDKSRGFSSGGEVNIGNIGHYGLDVDVMKMNSSSGEWRKRNYARDWYKERASDNHSFKTYEPTYYRMVGEMGVDVDTAMYRNELHGEQPYKLHVAGKKYSRMLLPQHNVKGSNDYFIKRKAKRTERHLRNQSVYKVSNKEAEKDPFVENRSVALGGADHHTAGIKILNPSGATYVYGETAYNYKKVEATFDVSSRTGNCVTGLVDYNGSLKGNHSNHSDKFINRVTTPGYAHSYLLTTILSPDYSDINGDGVDDRDLGGYTKMSYTSPNITQNNGNDVPTTPYSWRVPFQHHKASFNEGFFTKHNDQKGNYVYGEKELKYLDKIETKTHIALFDISERNDGYGVNTTDGEKGSQVNKETNSKMYKLDKVYLFSKPEYQKMLVSQEYKDADLATKKKIKQKNAIKVAHFTYDYTLCEGVPNNDHKFIVNGVAQKGKLTLKKVYFTYRASKMGRYTPYEFNYGQFDTDQDGSLENGEEVVNPNYYLKGYDVWGAYKPVTNTSCGIDAPVTNAEFPYVEQDKKKADKNAVAWNLTSVKMPSGGEMKVVFESDDYAYVQDQKVMQMFKVTGVGNGGDLTANGGENLYKTNLFDTQGSVHTHNDYIYVKLKNDPDLGLSRTKFVEQYLGNHIDKEIYFKFLLNMTKQDAHYDYVEGFFGMDHKHADAFKMVNINTGSRKGCYVAIKLNKIRKGGGTSGNQQVNPIAKAGWNFARSYLNRESVSVSGNSSSTQFLDIMKEILSHLGQVTELINGPNHVLQRKGCAQKMKSEKSWIRLMNPDGRKFGGGLRVRNVKLYDNWKNMTDHGQDQHYGQEYYYNVTGEEKAPNEVVISSGVATFEANGNKENPLVRPFYGDHPSTYGQLMAAPRESNYTLLPFGEAFYPSPKITYGKVMVKSIKRVDPTGAGKTVTKNAAGKVVSDFYTSKDFPVKTGFSDFTKYNDSPDKTLLAALAALGIGLSFNHLTMSQGFSVVTNDMDGSPKGTMVFADEGNDPISSVSYEYNVKENELDNNIVTINDKGQVSEQLVGQSYDVVNDFRETYAKTTSGGIEGNVGVWYTPPLPVTVEVMVLPKFSYHESIMRIATTTKVIRKTGLLKKKIVRDLGAVVSTENIAWDALTGEVLVTKTKNEYDDAYYSVKFPVHWAAAYSGMGIASKNLGFEGKFIQKDANSNSSSTEFVLEGYNGGDLTKIFHLGDELLISKKGSALMKDHYWVAGISDDKKTINLIDRFGIQLSGCNGEALFGEFKIVRSGYRNLQSAAMAGVTSMVNPVKKNKDYNWSDVNNRHKYLSINHETFDYKVGDTINKRIINASAVTYNEYWPSQRDGNMTIIPSDGIGINPYVYNIRGNWRAVRSYAYLTGRNSANGVDGLASTRREGYLTNFDCYYEFKDGTWKMREGNNNKWTFASEISKFTAQGLEIENKDALGHYSAAQFGQDHGIAQAVASNSEYREMGFAGFEHLEGPTAHFNFGGARSTEEAHTGTKSLQVGRVVKAGAASSVSSTVTWSLEDCEPVQVGGCPAKFPCIEDQTTAQAHTYPSGNGVNQPARAVREITLKGAKYQRVCYGFAYDISTLDNGNDYVKLFVNGQETEHFQAPGNKYYNADIATYIRGHAPISQELNIDQGSGVSIQSADRYVILDGNGEAKFKIETYIQGTSGQRRSAGGALMLEVYPQNTKKLIGTACKNGIN